MLETWQSANHLEGYLPSFASTILEDKRHIQGLRWAFNVSESDWVIVRQSELSRIHMRFKGNDLL